MIEKETDIVKLYNEGISVNEISRITGVYVQGVEKVLLNNGINSSENWKKKQQEKLTKALELYEAGMQVSKICTQLNVGPNTIRPFLLTIINLILLVYLNSLNIVKIFGEGL